MKNLFITIVAALAILTTTTSRAESGKGYSSYVKITPPQPTFPQMVHAAVQETSGGIQLYSYTTSPWTMYYAQISVVGYLNGAKVNRSWLGLVNAKGTFYGDGTTPTVTVPYADILGKPAAWARLQVWYWAPNGVYTPTNFLYSTQCDVWGDSKN